MRRSSQGLTLIELLVSLAVGILVSLAAVQLFVTNQQSFSLQRGMGDVQDNGRFALDFIGRDVRLADLRSQGTHSSERRPGLVMVADHISGGTAALASANDSIALGIGSSDQLTIQHASTVDNNRDCEGNVVPVNDLIVNRYFVRADTPAGSPSALACDGGSYTPNDGALNGFGDQGVVLLSSVDSFQVLYGVNDGTTSGCTPVRFVTAAAHQAMGAPPVVAMKVGILVRSQDTTGHLPSSKGFQVLDVAITPGQVPGDGKIRRLFTASMTLRNSVPDDCVL